MAFWKNLFGGSKEPPKLLYRQVTNFSHVRAKDMEIAVLLTESNENLRDLKEHYAGNLIPQAPESMPVEVRRASKAQQTDENFFIKVIRAAGLKRSGNVLCQYIDTREGPGGPESRFVVVLKEGAA